MRLVDADQFGVIALQGKSEEFIEGVAFILEKIDEAPTVEAYTFEQVKESGMNKDNPKPMIYGGFCDHDCESHYICPICKEDYGSWYFFHQGLKHGDTFKCLKCGQKLIISW